MTQVTQVTQIPGYGQIFYFLRLFGKKIKFSGTREPKISSLSVTYVTFSNIYPILEHYIYKLVTIVTISDARFIKAKILLMGFGGLEKVTIRKTPIVTLRHFFEDWRLL